MRLSVSGGMDLCVVGGLERLQVFGLIRFAAWALARALTKKERYSRAALPVEQSVVSVSSAQMRVCVCVCACMFWLSSDRVLLLGSLRSFLCEKSWRSTVRAEAAWWCWWYRVGTLACDS